MTRTRAYRLAQKTRKIRNAFRVYRDAWQEFLHPPYPSREQVLLWAKKHADNMALCSTCCGNPRHFLLAKGKEKLTVQERREYQEDPMEEAFALCFEQG